ncbi:MAG: DNA polymerase III subunit delta [Rhodobacteraceae bacterium]|nr:DNA polymerase III subunit delta [Paracoccaceae bacterium]
MKLAGRETAKYFAEPQPGRAGLLIYGPDSMRVAIKRQQVLKALVGPDAEAEMRLSRFSAAELRKDPAQLSDAIRAQGFFPGARAVFVEEAGDTITDIVKSALDDWQDGDATLVITAGQLAAKSRLRKYFETHPNAYAAAIYADPPGRDEIMAALSKAGLTNIGNDAMADLMALAQALEPGDFAQTLEKLALYMLSSDAAPTSADIAACAPATTEAVLDDALNLIAEARTGEVGPMMQKLEGQGINPVSICINATRHFRALHLAAIHPGGPAAGLSACRPPVFGPRRDRMARQARNLGLHKLESILAMLMDADLDLRSSKPIPARAMLERAFIRIAMLARN